MSLLKHAQLSTRQQWRMEIQKWALGQLGISQHSPFSMLDLGAEKGYSARSVLDDYPRASIDGVEVWGPAYDQLVATNYLALKGTIFVQAGGKIQCGGTPIQLYRRLYNDDAVDFLAESTQTWDVILCAELIEHLPDERGVSMLELMRERATKGVIVTSPIGYKSQGAMFGNPHQVHVSGWTPERMTELGYQTFALVEWGYSMGVYVWKP